ncbi:hypothetical protein XBO1_1940064 [Xenorhabdus bovienii str. oregonense]|uniref:Uncharacterized protein n=1 Tax=Xenorhabdus bovienii str. oregonense TaxID=1398202 RepID=A0A077P4N0_XENBV|nr:hypothetical protein XBO1_1940064 [Xenorhabdus bovienii str. oregonense]
MQVTLHQQRVTDVAHSLGMDSDAFHKVDNWLIIIYDYSSFRV